MWLRPRSSCGALMSIKVPLSTEAWPLDPLETPFPSVSRLRMMEPGFAETFVQQDLHRRPVALDFVQGRLPHGLSLGGNASPTEGFTRLPLQNLVAPTLTVLEMDRVQISPDSLHDLTEFIRRAAPHLEVLKLRYLQLPFPVLTVQRPGAYTSLAKGDVVIVRRLREVCPAVLTLGSTIMLLHNLRELHIQEGMDDNVSSRVLPPIMLHSAPESVLDCSDPLFSYSVPLAEDTHHRHQPDA